MIQIKTIVTCDHCTGSYTYSRAPYTKAKFNHIVKTLGERGWLIEKLGTHAWRVLCQDCAKSPSALKDFHRARFLIQSDQRSTRQGI